MRKRKNQRILVSGVSAAAAGRNKEQRDISFCRIITGQDDGQEDDFCLTIAEKGGQKRPETFITSDARLPFTRLFPRLVPSLLSFYDGRLSHVWHLSLPSGSPFLARGPEAVGSETGLSVTADSMARTAD